MDEARIVKAIGAYLIVSMSLVACVPTDGRPDKTASVGQSGSTDVASFKAKRDQCDHFRGEEPYDAARAKFIAEQVARHCRNTDADLRRLRAKYADDPAVAASLAAYETEIE